MWPAIRLSNGAFAMGDSECECAPPFPNRLLTHSLTHALGHACQQHSPHLLTRHVLCDGNGVLTILRRDRVLVRLSSILQ